MKGRELLQYLCKGCLDGLNRYCPDTAQLPRAPQSLWGPSRKPRRCCRDRSISYTETQTAPEETAPAHVGRDQQHKQLPVSFFPSMCFQSFYLSSADGKAGQERAQPVTSSQQMLLWQRIPHCPGGIHAGGQGMLPAPMGNSCWPGSCGFQHTTAHSSRSAVPQGNTTPWEHQSPGWSWTESPCNDSAAGNAGQQALPTAELQQLLPHKPQEQL